MPGNIRTTSAGVTGGTIDSPRRIATDQAERTTGSVAGNALSSRKHAGVRARKLAARRKQSRRR